MLGLSSATLGGSGRPVALARHQCTTAEARTQMLFQPTPTGLRPMHKLSFRLAQTVPGGCRKKTTAKESTLGSVEGHTAANELLSVSACSSESRKYIRR